MANKIRTCDLLLVVSTTLEGQALELAWIHDQVVDLMARDYYRLCLKKTCWYTAIFPCLTGAMIACGGPAADAAAWRRFGWYLGAAFQIQDDVLNLTGSTGVYGKEPCGDLWEGKRTLMLIHPWQHASASERALKHFLCMPRAKRTRHDVRDTLDLLHHHGSIDHARACARQFAGAALMEASTLLRGARESEHKWTS